MAVWINEIHYDNSGADTQEGVEIAGTAGTDLTGWTIVPYNGNTPGAAVTYTPIGTLSGTIPNQQNGFGTVYVSIVGLQNGPNDGLALVDNNGNVVQLLSYEGVFTASNGPASGMTATDIGVSQAGTQTDAFTIQLQGTGNQYSDFTWAAGVAATRGGVNTGQTFTAAGPVLPTLGIDDVSMAEGNAGTVTFTFTVSLSAPAGPGGVTFDIATADGTAIAGSDYTANALTGQTIPEGSSTYQFHVQVAGDTDIEPNETFFVNVTNITGAIAGDAQGQGTIQNDDTPPVPAASIDDVAIAEGAQGVAYLNFTVTLSFAPTGPVTIDYATSDGTASAGSDFLAVSGTLSFAAGETTKTIAVPIIGDTVPEAHETLTVTLSNPSGATISDGTATGTIQNDDGPLYFPLSSGSFSENWTDTSRIATNDDWSAVPYIIGYLGDIDGGSPTGVDPRTLTGGYLGQVDVIANQNTAGSTSGGVGEFQIANPTIGLQGSGTADAPSIVLYMDATGRTNIRLQASLRDIDGSADNAVQPINVQYRTEPGNDWTNVPGGYFADVTTGGSATQVTALDVTLPPEADNAPRLEIRIMTVNAPGNDEWVGIDDIVVSSDAGPGAVISIGNAAVVEGDSGTTQMVFTVTRSGDSSGTASADYEITLFANGSAYYASPDDLAPGQPLSGVVTFAPGETTKTIVLDIQGDLAAETDENLTVELSNPVGAVFLEKFGTGTIINDDGEPALVSVSDPVVVEGNGGTTALVFTVSRTGSPDPFTVDYATSSGPEAIFATAGVDYVAASGTLSFAAGEMSKTVEITVNGDTDGEIAEILALNLSNPSSPATLLKAVGIGTIQNDDILFIHQIQGSSYYSPLLAAEGKNGFNVASATTVVVQAVVTAVDADGPRQGFYITEESGDWDADWLTSEGIFVMTRDDFGAGGAVSGVNVGDIVTVTAQVMEYQAFSSMPRTMLVNPSSIVVDSSGNPLPVMVLDAGRPIPNSIMTLETPDLTSATGATFDATRYALSFWETVEGMLVTVPDMVVADGFITTSGGRPIFQAYSLVHADADQVNGRGGYTVAGDPPDSPPDTADPDDDTIAGGRHLHDGDVNPDIIEIDFSGFATPPPAGLVQMLSMGDRLGDVTGIVEFDFTDRKIFVTDYDGSGFVNAQPARETTALGNDGRSLTVATFNVENLDPGDGQARFDALADAIAANLNAPDIIMIEEIQDNNGTASGTTDASITWQMLVDALNARVPGARYQWVDQDPANNAEGGAGNGNIRVGFLYDTNRVQLGDLAWDAPIEDRRKYTDRIGDGVRDPGDLILFSDDMVAAEINAADWTNTRKSLLGQFTFSGNTVFLVANHFTAKGGSGEFWQLNQDLAAGEPENAGWSRRVQQAEDVWHVMDLIQSGGGKVVAGGDFNDFYFYRPLEVLTGYVETDGSPRVGGARFDNLTLTLTEAERYTYTFDGRSQALDHIVASQGLAAVATYDIVHINTGYNALGTGADASPRLSDHDPGLASFDFRSLNEILVLTEGNDTIDVSQGGDDQVSGLGGNDQFFFGAAFTAADRVDGGAGFDSIWLKGDYNLTFDAASFTGIERLGLLSADAGLFAYSLTTVDANVAAGATLLINATSLEPGEGLTFVGLAETDGRFVILSGACDDLLVGGAGNDEIWGGAGSDRIYGMAGADRISGGLGGDLLWGGGGPDVFVYASAAESTSLDFDTLDRFNAGADRIDLPTAVSGWTGNVSSGSLDFATFDADLAAAVDGALSAFSAVLFTPDSGDFAGWTFAVIDADGDGAYQAGSDYVFEFLNPVAPLTDSAVYFV